MVSETKKNRSGRPFQEQAFYNKRPFGVSKGLLLNDYVNDFFDWYIENVEFAPALDGAEYMTCYSELGPRQFRNRIRRGVGPFLRKNKRYPNFLEPNSHTEMTLLSSIISPLPRLNCADKLNVGKYIPEAYRREVRTAKVFDIFEKGEDVNFEKLDTGSFYLKSNHASAQIIHVSTSEEHEATLPEIRKRASSWLSSLYGGKSSQWWYKLITPKVFFEEDLRRKGQDSIDDFKFHMVNGELAVLQAVSGRQGQERSDAVFVGNELKYLNKPFLRQNLGPIELPKTAPLALEVAREISKKFKYLRVDFYLFDDDIVLGELTVLPNSGRRLVRSSELNDHMCDFWHPMPKIHNIIPTGIVGLAHTESN